MSSFSFKQAAHEATKPEGEYTFVFERLGGDERREVAADGVAGAWEGIRYHEGDDWHEWRLLGFKDLVARGLYDVQVSLHFAQARPEKVAVWDAD